MTEDQFKARWQHIREQHRAMKAQTESYIDQELAKLFIESHWTQEKIAEFVGRKQTWVCQALRFGRFLDFIATAIKLETPRNLTERKFRGYWERTEGAKEEQRFRQVAEAMQGHLILEKQRTNVGEKIAAKFKDWKWYTVEEICEAVDADEEQVKKACYVMETRSSQNMRCEKRKYRATVQYRFKPIKSKPLLNIKVQQFAEQILELVEEGFFQTTDSTLAEYSRKQTESVFQRIQRLCETVLGDQPKRTPRPNKLADPSAPDYVEPTGKVVR